MAIALHVDTCESNGTILIRHTFFGETLKECENLRDEHSAGCKSFGPAMANDNVIEWDEEVDEIPEWEDD